MTMRWVVLSALAVGLVGCGGAKTSATVTGTDESSIQSSPAGAATVAFVDIETVRPDDASLDPAPAAQVTDASALPAVVGCRTVQVNTTSTTRTVTITFNQCPASNGWLLNGTLTFSAPITKPGHYTVVHQVHSLDATGTKGWNYTGTKLVTIDLVGRTASISLPAGTTLTAAYHDSQNTSKNRTYQYVPDLSASWTLAGQFSLSGSYTFAQDGGTTLAATITSPLVWTSGCCSPTQGTLTLSAGNSLANAVFGPNCGDLKINGTKLPLSCQ